MPVASDAQLAAKLRTLSAVRRYSTVPESTLRTSLCAFVSKEVAESLARATASFVVRHAVTHELAKLQVGHRADVGALAASDALLRRLNAQHTSLMAERDVVVLSEANAVDVVKRVRTGNARLVPSCIAVGGAPILDGGRRVRTICAFCERTDPLTSESHQLCACGALIAHKVCLAAAAKTLKHECIPRESQSRLVCSRLICENAHFPFVALADCAGVVRGVVSLVSVLVAHVDDSVRPVIHGLDDVAVEFIVNHQQLVRQTLAHAERVLLSTCKPRHEVPPKRYAIEALRETSFGGRPCVFCDV
jgi:hypothetical protein